MAKRYNRSTSYSKENHRNPNGAEKTEDDEEEDDLLSRKDVDRLSSLWKSLKETKKNITSNNNQTPQQPSIHRSFQGRQQKCNNENDESFDNEEEEDEKRQVNSSLNELKQTRFEKEHLQQQYQQQSLLLEKAKDSNKQLLKRLKDAHDELEQCHSKIAKLMSSSRQDKKSILEIEERLAQHAVNQKEVLERSRQNACELEESLQEKERREQERSVELQRLIESNQIAVEQMHIAQQQLEDVADENTRLRSLCEQIQTEAAQLRTDAENYDAMKAEVNQLTAEVARLLGLLSLAGPELRSLSMEGVPMRFLKDNANFIKNFQAKTPKVSTSRSQLPPYSSKRACSGCSKKDTGHSEELKERQLWVVKEAAEFARKLNVKEGNVLSSEAIEELLFGLQLIWKGQEEEHVAKMNKQHQKEMNELKKQIDRTLPYDEMQARNRLKRLRQEMSKFKRDGELQQQQQIQSQQQSQYSGGVSSNCTARNDGMTNLSVTQSKEKIIYFQDALKLFQEYESELRESTDEVKRLKDKVSALMVETESCDKIIYLEGALWACEKLRLEGHRAQQLSMNECSQLRLEFDKLACEVDDLAVLAADKGFQSRKSQTNQNHNSNNNVNRNSSIAEVSRFERELMEIARIAADRQVVLHTTLLRKIDGLVSSLRTSILNADSKNFHKKDSQSSFDKKAEERYEVDNPKISRWRQSEQQRERTQLKSDEQMLSSHKKRSISLQDCGRNSYHHLRMSHKDLPNQQIKQQSQDNSWYSQPRRYQQEFESQQQQHVPSYYTQTKAFAHRSLFPMNHYSQPSYDEYTREENRSSSSNSKIRSEENDDSSVHFSQHMRSHISQNKGKRSLSQQRQENQ